MNDNTNAITEAPVDRLMQKVDGDIAQTMIVGAGAGGIGFRHMVEVMEFSKLMATGDIALPQHLRRNVGACLAVTMQAVEWRMSPFQVANKSYSVNNRLAFESQLIHAVVEARAPLQKRLRAEYEGEGPTRRCIVSGLFKGEAEPHVYESPLFRDIKVKNSPLWASDPDQQLWYYATRAWARRYCPDVLLGIYTKEEIEAGLDEHAGAPSASATPVLDRLKEGGSVSLDGYDPEHINDELQNIAANAGVDDQLRAGPDEADMRDVTPPKGGRKKGAAKPEPEPAGAPAEPTNKDEYRDYAMNWIEHTKSAEDAHARWDGEVDMRAALKVPVEMRKAIEKQLVKKHGRGG